MSAAKVIEWIRDDPVLWQLLEYVRDLALPDCWIDGGFVRNASTTTVGWYRFRG